MDGGGESYPSVDINDISTIIDVEEVDDDDAQYATDYKRFDDGINTNYILKTHPEHVAINHKELEALTKIIKTPDGEIRDPLHRSPPFLTKYEKARILGQRAAQINSGSKAFVDVPGTVVDGYIVAELELRQKKIPFIIQRPIPNGTSEYWRVQDLEQIHF